VGESGSIVCHVVPFALKVILEVKVPMEALMDRSHAQEFGRWAGRRGGPFVAPEHGGEIVRFVLGGAFSDIKALGGCFLLEEATGKFKIGVGYVTLQVLVADQARL
jgi:hypothetical protein